MKGSGLQQVALVAVDHFLKVLEVEVHEKTLCHTLDMLALWGAKFTNELPKKLVDGFKVRHDKYQQISTIRII